MKFLRTLPYFFIATILFCSSLHSASTDSLHIFTELIGEKPNDYFNIVKGVGDINGDGYDDFMVGAAYKFSDVSAGNYVKLYYGGPLFDTAAALVFRYPESRYGNCNYGYAITSGDYNGDGYKDIAIGAPYYGPFQHGIVYIYYGGEKMDTTADMTITSFAPYYHIGYSLATGDLNGDGTDDLIVGAPFDDISSKGRIYIYFGGKNFGDKCGAKIEGKDFECFGYSISIAGDINKDGCMDILVGAPSSNGHTDQRGKGYLIYGNKDNKLDSMVVLNNGEEPFDQLYGLYTSSLGDFNGDGYDDFAVMSLEYFHIYSGKTLELLKRVNTNDKWRRFTSLCGGADVNNDGYPDIIVGVENDYYSFSGAMAIFLGGKDIDTIPDYINNGRYRSEYFANKIDCAGDINGDGYKDIIVGSLEGPNCNKSGSAILLSLNKTLDVTDKNETEVKDYKLFQNYPNPFNPSTTISYDILKPTHITLKLYNMLGREIAILVDKDQLQGNYKIDFDASNYNLSSGIYFIRIRAGNDRQNHNQSIKISLIK